MKCIEEDNIIDITLVQEIKEMKRRSDILKKHPYSIWEGKDGYWHTYLANEDGTRKSVKRKERKDVEKIIIKCWEERNIYSFKIRFQVWMERQKKCGRSDNTIYRYEADYKRFFEGDKIEYMSVEDINDEYISEFIQRLLKRKEISYRALKAMYGHMRGMFDKCIMDKIITDNPCKYVDLPLFKQYCQEERIKTTEERTLSDAESKALLEKIKNTYISKPAYIPQYAVELSLYTGMRVGELSGLKWVDIDSKRKTITVRRSEKFNFKTKEYYISTTKNDKVRVIPLTPQMEQVLERVRKVEIENGFLGEFVFTNEKGRVHSRTISHCVRNRTMTEEFCNSKSIHAIRRTLNSNLRCNGMSVTVAASILGHTEKVNEENYTYDVSNMDYKKSVISGINMKLAQM